ncbi:MAG: carboxypeptidase-like regulatory domain-containing protein [Cyclobacteriaceae bacterium]
MNRITILLSLIISFCIADAQNLAVESQVVDETGAGVPFAAVGIVAKNFGTVTFEDGSFSLPKNEDYKQDTLIVSAIGFERRKLAYTEFIREKPKTIKLEEKVVQLEEVIVTKKGWKISKIGEKRRKTSSALRFYGPKEGTTLAVLFNEERKSMFIREISIAVGINNLKDADFRCMLFSADEQSLPSEQLFKKNIIQKITDEKGTVTFTLPEEFWIDQPFYIGFEWVISREQFVHLKEIQDKYPLNFLDNYKRENPDQRFSVRNNKSIHVSTLEGQLIREIPLSEQQIDELALRKESNPGIFYQIHVKEKGLKTVSGSYITNQWRVFDFHALVSIEASVEPE